MTRHGFRIAYETLRTAMEAAVTARDAEAELRAGAELDAFVAAMVTDPRKLRAVALDSPACAAEIRARAEELEVPRRVLDPAHDAAFARLWLATLDDGQIGMLQRVLSDEARRRAPPGAESFGRHRQGWAAAHA